MAGRVKRTRKGFALRISGPERDLLRDLPAQLRGLLTEARAGSDPDLRRLFPPAYVDDEERAAEYESMVRDDLVAERLRSIDVMERTIDAERLSEDEVVAWLSAINDVRLVLGTRLDVTEDLAGFDLQPEDPRAPALSLYAYLSSLEEDVVAALGQG